MQIRFKGDRVGVDGIQLVHTTTHMWVPLGQAGSRVGKKEDMPYHCPQSQTGALAAAMVEVFIQRFIHVYNFNHMR
jgi:hypothetical protein